MAPRAPRNTTTRDRHRRIIAQGKPPCHWCGEPIDYDAERTDPNAFEVDHVHPLSRGGPDTLDNKVPSHRRCNGVKGAAVDYNPDVTYVTARKWWA